MSKTTPTFKRAKILATVGPACDSYEQLRDMVKTGVNGFRLNFSHGTHEERETQIPWIRKASEEVGKPVAILQDLQGPKIRLGDIGDTIPVKMGEQWALVYGKDATNRDKNELEVQYDISKKMKVGERLYIFDGKIKTQVVAVEPHRVLVHIENDGVLMPRKGLNLPDTDFGGDVITEKDKKDLAFGAKHDIDYVAMSFVQTAADVKQLRELLREHGSTAHIVSKVETQAAIQDENLEAIIEASDAVMVARGDLAVETSP